MASRPAASDCSDDGPGLADLEMLLRPQGQVFQPWRSDNRDLAHPAWLLILAGRSY